MMVNPVRKVNRGYLTCHAKELWDQQAQMYIFKNCSSNDLCVDWREWNCSQGDQAIIQTIENECMNADYYC